MLAFNRLALRRGADLLLSNVSFTIHQGRKVGLVGANGSGKSSLFKLIIGELEADNGELDMPADISIAHMSQEIPATEQIAVDYVLAGDDRLVRIESALQAAESSESYGQIGQLHDELASIDGYSARARAEKLLHGLGFKTDEFNEPLSSFSGGWRVRLNLARTLMQPSDLLLLDEPTNHLDLDAILWLSDWIRHYQGTMILITHDREFLDECVDQIANIAHGTIELVTGNFSQFERIKAERMAEQQSLYVKQQKEISHMQDFVRRFRYKASKARQAQSRLKALEKMERIAPAHVDSPFSFSIRPADKVSDPLLKLDEAILGYDSPVLSDVKISLRPEDRVGLLGPNGAGKTTLIKSIHGELAMLGGELVAGRNLRTGYFSQHQVDDLNLSATAFDHIQALDRRFPDQQIRNFLGGFNFHGNKVEEPVATFSGGEKARLALAMVTFNKPNLILMDEPTNHLDMDMRQALTIALQEFSGAILLISHDRHLLESTVDRFLLVDDGKVVEYDGDLATYRRRVLGTPEPGAKSEPRNNLPRATKPVEQKKPADHKKARQLKTRINTVEKSLSRLQRKLEAVEAKLADPEQYDSAQGPGLQSLIREQVELKSQVADVEEEWLALQESLEDL